MRCVPLASLLAIFVPAAAAADEPAAPSEPLPDEVIVVTGLRLPRAAHDVPAAVTVIDKDQLQRSPQSLADDLVRLVPSVGTFRRSSSGIADPTSQGLNLRGVGPSGVSRALVLRDGLPVNDPFGGWVYWRALSPFDIDRIEIVPSGGSALFGNFGLGGVMQLITRPIEARELDLVLSGGSLGTERFAARATERQGDFGVELSADASDTNGYTPIVAAQRGAVDGPAGSSHVAGRGRVEYASGGSTAHAEARVFNESLNAGTQHTTADVRTFNYDAGWQLVRELGTLSAQLFGGTQLFRQERARVAADRSTAASASQQRTPSNNQGAVVTWTGNLTARHTLVFGVDGQRVAGTATDALTPAMVTPTTLTRRSAGGEQRFVGAFAQDAARLLPELEVAAAVRLDAWQNVSASRTLTTGDGSAMTTPLADVSEVQLDPRLGVLFHANHEVALRGSVYRGFRAPTLNELYRPFQVGAVLTAANDRLKPERLWGGELGPQIALDRLNLQATGFWNELRDPIANVTLAQPLDGATRERQNLGSARILGLELDLVWRPDEAWMVRIDHTYSDGKVTSAPAQPALLDKRLAQDPHHRTVAAVSYTSDKIATIGAQARYLGPMFEDDLNTQPIGAVVLVDARIDRGLGSGVSVFASAQNLFDRHYLVGRAGIDTEGAPRTFELGVAYHGGGARSAH